MKKIITLSVIVMLVMVILVMGGCANSAPAPTTPSTSTPATSTPESAPVSAESIKIGMVTPLTGNVATYGQSHLKGMTMAFEEINAQGGDKFELITYDDTGNPQQAATGAQKFSDQKDIMLITGSCTSSCTLAMVPITDKAQIPHMVVSSSAAKLDGASPYFSRMASLDAQVGKDMINVMVDSLDAKTVVIIFANTDSGKALQQSCDETAKERGLQVLDTISYLENDQDFGAIVTTIKNLNPDAIALCGYYTDSALFLKQARQTGVTAVGVGSVSIYSPKLIEVGGDAVEGTILLAPFLASSPDPKVQEFVKKYEDKYGIEPDSYAALAYDQGYVIADAVRRAKDANNGVLTREALNVAVRATEYSGVTGNINFNDLGNWVRPFLYTIVEDGRFVLYQ